MKTAGIIAEYNPFHEGHKYHIEETRKCTGADYVIAVMSGDYVQRGEPAIADKYVRTRMALNGGADLVIELPCVYATASAESFARAGVKLLDGLGLVDVLSFGSEWAGKEELDVLAGIFIREPDTYKTALKQGLKQGLNYPAARAQAVVDYLSQKGEETSFRGTDVKEGPDSDKKGPDPENKGLEPGNKGLDPERVRRILAEPNHILAIEYLKALKRWQLPMESLVIKRSGSGYHEEEAQSGYASATAVRKIAAGLRTREGSDSDYSKADHNKAAGEWLRRALGPSCDLFMDHYLADDYVMWDDLIPFLHYIFLYKGEMIGKYAGMDLELSNRIRNIYEPEYDFETFIKRLHSRNRTDTALARALLHIVLQIKQKSYLEDGADPFLPYARILGFRKEASALLKRVREQATMDIIQKLSLVDKVYRKRSMEKDLFLTDIRSADLYELIASGKSRRMPVKEMTREQVII